MQFLALDNLIFFLIIPAILLFYLLKRKYEDYQVSSILLWHKAVRDIEASKPWQRLRRNLLLILQLLIALLIILSLLKPAFETDGVIAEHTIIVLDTSASMLTIEDGKTRFQLATAEIEKLINNLNSTEAITLIEMGKTPKIQVAKSSNRDELRNALTSITPGEGTGDDLAAFSLAKSIAASESNTGIMWFGDGANYKLNTKDELLPSEVSFKHFQVGKNRENVTIGTFVTQQLDSDKNIGLIRIDNNGGLAQEGDLAIYDISGQLIDTYAFEVEGDSSFSIQLENLPKSEAYQAKIEVENDSLLEDNQLWSVPFTQGEVQATLIIENGNQFISQALKATKLVNLNQANEYKATNESDTDLWIFDGYVPNKLPNGSALIIGPNNSSDWLTYKGAKPLQDNLKITQPNHQLVKNTDWENVHIAEIKEIEQIEGLEVLIEAGNNPILLAGKINGNRVIILNFDLHQSDLPLRTTFPILMQNSINWLSPIKTLPIPTSYTNDYINIPFTPGSSDRAITRPDDVRTPLTDSGTMIGYEIPNKSGLYKIEETINNQREARYFSVQMNSTEAAIAPQSVYVSNYQMKQDEEKNITEAINYREITSLFILLALIILFIEWVVYKRGY